MAPRNLLGNVFGRLTVISKASNNIHGKAQWLCKCECGKVKIVLADSLISGKTRSCGCLQKEIAPLNNPPKHGMSRTRLWTIWCGMKSRCYYPKNIAYKDYGGRGIKVCDEWLHDFLSFFKWSMKNGYAENLTIDRINYDGNYAPSNCKWSTYEEQENNRRDTVFLTISGIKLPVSEWARKVGISAATLRWRIDNGWKENEILMRPNLNNKNIRRQM
ncbi:hypothetical protein EQM14_01505 [Caproiciproducens sp. NJN-50]|uniref:hypothetical protein n=1 Tax=Caproiciproducens sp. NJN-50 TaxID=2507162 RepID=UPI000FFE14A2|nr:hypothetical protein [Caproiciproducens sp. NJN-50]QAT48560.1 hypothetical protein EQM14_01505 [Caproiciproducens sp. NJN-50]